MINNILRKGLVFIVIALFTLTSIIPSIAGEGETYFYANQDIPVQNGGISGDYTDTLNSDDTYEGISERESGGKPSKRYSYLEHKWTFDLSGSFNTINFYIEAYHTANSEDDDFIFAYSTNDASYTDILTVTKTIDDDNYQSAELSNTLSGTIYIRVKDSDRSQGNRALDAIFIDHMYIVGDSGPDVTPPVISDVLSSITDYTWINQNPSYPGDVLDEREFVAMAYDSSADRSILFGGDGISSYDDTWEYNYNTNMWLKKNPSYSGGNLSFRSQQGSPGFAYDPDADRSILFGGYDGSSFYNETWEYNHNTNTWTNRFPSVSGGTLTGRTAIMMAYYDSVDRMIMFGGIWLDGGQVRTNETWEYNYNTNTWTNRSPTHEGVLPPFILGGMAYDSSADRLIYIGGNDGSNNQNETWAYNYNNNTWWKLNPSFVGGTLSVTNMNGLVYDSGADRSILFGGDSTQGESFGNINDTWSYNANDNTWYKVNFEDIGGELYGREAFGLVYDSTSGKTIVACGFIDLDGPMNGFTNETWTLNMNEYTATITWTTDELSDSIVNYGTTTALGNTTSDSTLVTNHQITLTGLLPDANYYYEVQSTDASNNTAIDDNNGNYYTFTTEQDTTPPGISNVQATGISHNSATITWDTDESSNSRVNYGTTIVLGDTEFDSAIVTSHSITLIDLLPDTIYYYEVQSTDGEGNTAIDNNSGTYYTFTTEQAPSNVMHVYSIDMWYEPTCGTNQLRIETASIQRSRLSMQEIMLLKEPPSILRQHYQMGILYRLMMLPIAQDS